MGVKKGDAFPGFTALSDQVFVREGDVAKVPEDHPHTVVIFGWGDGLPKHVMKYSDGYQKLYPHSKQLIALGPIFQVMLAHLEARTDSMIPMRQSLGALHHGDTPEEKEQNSRVLMHAMSNTGAINCAATLSAYRRFHGMPLPHKLVVLDSTPGNPYLSLGRLMKWSKAMTIGTAGWFPWPSFVTQGMWTTFLLGNASVQWLAGEDAPGVYALKSFDDELLSTKDAKRMYLYSKEDDIISWEDIEMYSAESERLGWDVRREMFEGSNHVGHMRQHPEQYWNTIQEAWEWSLEKKA